MPNAKYILLAGMLFSMACNTIRQQRKQIENAMLHYDLLIENQDAKGISMLYTPDGKPGGIASGRDSIYKLLSSFKNVRVLLQRSSTDTIQIEKNTAIQKTKIRSGGCD